MTPQALAVGLILILVVLVIMYVTRKRLPSGGNTPNVSSETYLYYDPSNPNPSAAQASALAKGYQGHVATPGELSYYASLGGVAGWCGVTSTGDVLAVPGSLYSPDSPVTSSPCCVSQTGNCAQYGVWVTGPKVVAGTKNVSPFNCADWYQPAPAGGS